MDPFTGDFGHNLNQLIDRDHAVLAKIDWIPVRRPHDAIDPLHTVVDIAVGTSLFSIAPDFDRVTILR